MSKPMMKCGHAANATRQSDNAPVCAICYGIVAGADIVRSEPIFLEGRKAKCSYSRPGDGNWNRPGHKDGVPSSPTLPFFSHQPGKEYDEYYCGCFGWD